MSKRSSVVGVSSLFNDVRVEYTFGGPRKTKTWRHCYSELDNLTGHRDEDEPSVKPNVMKYEAEKLPSRRQQKARRIPRKTIPTTEKPDP